MKANQLGKTLGDYVAIAICPALIMALVGSLVFFLIEVLYHGQYPERLQHVFACFIFAAVLIARISMDNSSSAVMYGMALGASALLCLYVFVEFPKSHPLYHFTFLVNIGMLGIVWWSAHKLTWDCTFIDESQEAGGEGLLDAAGLDTVAAGSKSEDANGGRSPDSEPKAMPYLAWWDRWLRYMAERKNRPHTPGVWVVYFSLAALPLFGLGQMLMSGASAAQRSYSFKLLAIYVASGLGLLLTTTYLGLRRYLRQRKLKMPGAMTAVWLALGGGLILALLGVGMILPRPSPDSAFSKWVEGATSSKRQASKNAVLRDGAGKGQGNVSKNAKGDPQAKPGAGQQPGQQGAKKPGENPTTSGKGNNQSGSGQNKGQSGQSGKPNQQGNQSGQKQEQNQGNPQQGGQNGERGQGEKRQDGNQNQQNQNADQNKSDSESGQENNSQDQEKKDESDGGDSGDSSNYEASKDMFEHAPEWGGAIASIMKWIMIIIGVVLGGYFLLKALANFMPWARGLLDWLRNLWESLFGKRPSAAEASANQLPAEEVPETPPPFSSFRNPFHDGSAARMRPEQLVRYTFAALESWAWEQRMGRKPEETPLEFAERVGDITPKLAGDLKRVAQLYAFVAYARGKLPLASADPLRQFWQNMEARTPAPAL
jgi:hypothetical protein